MKKQFRIDTVLVYPVSYITLASTEDEARSVIEMMCSGDQAARQRVQIVRGKPEPAGYGRVRSAEPGTHEERQLLQDQINVSGCLVTIEGVEL